MASCDALALFTTPIELNIKDSTSTFDGSYGRCSQSDQLHSFEGKKSPALPIFGQRNGSATCEAIVLCQSPQAVERQMLSRLYKLKSEIEIFLRESKNNFHVQFYNEEFVVILAYLADIFGHLNDMNLFLQGRDVTATIKAGLTVRMGVWQARFKVESTTYYISFVGKAAKNK